MKNFLFLYLGLFNLSISQNTISSDSISQLKEVEVIYKAHALSPITYQNITEDQIQELSVGQEPALLFSNTPSIIAHADAGHTQGYSYFTLRGIDQTRINITLDGVPLNDPADQAFYFSNYADILNSIEKIQIQRGIGTSKNGTASYAGSIEMFSPNLYNTEKLELGLGYGSFNTLRTFGIYNSGIKNQKGLYVRISKIYSDGFKQHASNNSQSLFLSGGKFGELAIWKVNLLAGNQKNELAWMPVPEDAVNCDRTTNANSEFEKDNFSQILLQIQNTLTPHPSSTIQSSIYYNVADGWWDFDLLNYSGNGDESTIESISRNALTSNLIGFYSNYKFKKNHINSTTGIHLNTYSNAFTEMHMNSEEIWNQNTKYKHEVSLFQKAEYQINSLLFSADIQYRKSSFKYEGDVNLNELSWDFINPKVGVSYSTHANTLLYFNMGKTGREPTRYDMFGGYDVLEYLCTTNPITGEYIVPELDTHPEYVRDYEFGIRSVFTNFDININGYYLDFKNERVLNGAYGPNGLALTNNVESSIRTGIEIYSSYNLSENIKLVNNSSYNYSLIQEQNIEFKPILTPPIIINQEIIYSIQDLKICLSTRYQSKSYINFENTESLQDYILINARVDYSVKNYSISIFMNNITDNFYFNNGIVDWDGTNKYFVQAPRNMYVSIKAKF
ncbi:MAG: TonB-dependent receptor [Flavobacteriales bacterium]|nr:TonB-dependent receptor [Flavobacteriales bacterium]